MIRGYCGATRRLPVRKFFAGVCAVFIAVCFLFRPFHSEAGIAGVAEQQKFINMQGSGRIIILDCADKRERLGFTLPAFSCICAIYFGPKLYFLTEALTRCYNIVVSSIVPRLNDGPAFFKCNLTEWNKSHRDSPKYTRQFPVINNIVFNEGNSFRPWPKKRSAMTDLDKQIWSFKSIHGRFGNIGMSPSLSCGNLGGFSGILSFSQSFSSSLKRALKQHNGKNTNTSSHRTEKNHKPLGKCVFTRDVTPQKRYQRGETILRIIVGGVGGGLIMVLAGIWVSRPSRYFTIRVYGGIIGGLALSGLLWFFLLFWPFM